MKIQNEEIMSRMIEEKRQEMISMALNYGYTSHLSIQASQELDSLLNAISFNHNHPLPVGLQVDILGMRI